MTGHKNVSDLQSMYEVFLRTAWYILKDKARVVMLVLRGLQLTRIIRKLSGRYRNVHGFSGSCCVLQAIVWW